MLNKTDPWTDDEPLECVSILPETPNVITVCFQAPSGRPFDFKAGQFLTLELPVPGGPLYRTWTISSSPSRPLSLTLTMKAQPDSIGTRWVMDNLKPGMTLKALGPAGRFTAHEHPAEKYLFISAGSGITPMMSMTTEIYDKGRSCDIVFVNCARKPSEIIFRERLEHIASRSEGIELKWVVQEKDKFRPWTGFQGQFNQLMLGLMAPDYLEREVFCCGPEGFMTSVREALAGLGYDMDRYHQESFQAPGTPGPELVEAPIPEDDLPEENVQAEIVFDMSEKTISVPETETVLAAARSAGIAIPSGCTFGVCGTCKTMKLSGEVHMVHNGGITEDEIEEGYILACCSNPRGKVVLDL
ncbi:hybrid-cluster NAD(P)-dependent oxidoreductase [Citreicella sp. C3M06]|uniref:hybrid-cluster NAD(P)-dependent oxidoreductase n=1 Tax=Roseobacteraceae TaxID=2854170 RepID=UPI001C08C93A|nr:MULTISPECIES: hybrid-cluster NAD(P)-dependent oxidoreductase [Roseobacteraceae]MBU2959471.1 hybrid-cluster NAD(P)-dependent oxidoreductase [Citreicella sp. C3M06]MDO6586271.1 hybrid-cluster NAD(P)-dependent oxidoreductase [Salipiger sp. 1_MG-2023]